MKTNRFLSLIIILLLSFTIVSCGKNNNNNGNNNVPEVKLPSKEEVKTVRKDEVIYINMAGDGQVLTMKATNRITDSLFSYYKEYGSFLLENNLNITSPKGPIIIEDSYALIPSLEKNDNMFYTLSLDEKHYKTKLPFIISITYKLDGTTVEYSSLKGVSGKVEMTYNFQPNKDADEYFLNNFAAQVQIPFNINNAKNIVANGAMQNTLVGQTATLVYMIMPNSDKTFTITFDAVDFTFEGMQAVLQPFDLNSITSMLPIDFDKDIDFSELGNIISLDLNSFSEFEDSIDLFLSFGLVSEMFGDLDELFSLLNIIPDLNVLEDPNIYNLEHLNEMADVVEIKRTIDYFINNFESLQLLLANLQNKLVPFMNKYNKDFNKIEQILTQITLLEQIIGSLGGNPLNLNLIIENFEAIIPVIDIILNSVSVIRNNLNDIVKSFYFLANDLEPIVNDLKTVLLALESLPLFYEQFELLGIKLATGKGMGWFKVEEEYKIDLLLQSLGQLKEYEDSFSIDEKTIQLLNKTVDLFNIDDKTNIRNIDLLILQLLTINESLSTPEQGKLSLYDIVDVLSLLMNFLDYLPTDNQTIKSFLSDLNEIPNSIQFIIKQRGI